MNLAKLLRKTPFIIIATVLLVSLIASVAAYNSGGIGLFFQTTVKEPIILIEKKGLPESMWPGSTATIEFKLSNIHLKPYLVNCTITLPSPEDGLFDGKGFDVLSFTVNGENRTSDLLDDGVAHFVIDGGSTVKVVAKIIARGDAPSGKVDIGINVLRTIALDDPPKYIHLSWSKNDVYHTMTIMWWTQFDVSGNTVVYDTVSHKNDSIDSYRFQATATTHRVCAYGKCFPGYWHEVTLTNLEPGKTYYFRVGGVGGWSEEYKFRTIAPDKPVEIIVSGDSRRPWGNGYELKVHPESLSNYPYSRIWVSKAVAAEDPDAVVFVGDLVESGNNWEEWEDWFKDVTDNLVTSDGRIIPIVAVIGNHEMGAYPNIESTYDWFKGLFANPGNELWYSLDFPYTHLTVLATTGGCVGTWWGPAIPEAKNQTQFLAEDLASTNAKWRLIAFHVPWYDCFESGTGYTSEVYMKYWAPIIEQYPGTIVFNGHVHNYMRSWPLKTVKIEEVQVNKSWTKVGYKHIYELVNDSSKGITYVVAGTWGAPTDPFVKGGECQIRDFTASAYARPMYVVLEINATNIHYVAKDPAGHVLDEVTFPYTVEEFTTPDYNIKY